jgi:hypothetical protein
LTLDCQPKDGSIGKDLKMLAVCLLAGVQDAPGIGFQGIATATGIREIVVMTNALGGRRTRLQVLHAEGIFANGKPTLPPQAVDAAKMKLVAQSRFVRLIVRVSERPVAAKMDLLRILKNQSGQVIKRVSHGELSLPPVP